MGISVRRAFQAKRKINGGGGGGLVTKSRPTLAICAL